MLLAMTLLMSTSVFAVTENEALDNVKNKLTAAGVPTEYIPAMIDHLSNQLLTKSEADLLAGKVDSLKAQIGDRTNKGEFKVDELQNIFKDADATAQSFGLDLIINDDKSITVYDMANKVNLATNKPAELKKIALGIDTVLLKEAIYAAVEYSQVVVDRLDKENQVPNVGGSTGNGGVTGNYPIMATPMKKTATNNGNILVAGMGLLAVAGAVLVFAKKKSVA